MKFVVHTKETAPPASRKDLETAEKLFGFIPNLLGVLAEAPIALEAYIILTKLLEDASLSAVEQQVVMLAGSHEYGCGYCMAAHSTVAGIAGMPPLVLAALRGGTRLPDPKLDALCSFVLRVIRSRGRVSAEQIDAFLAAGYSAQSVLEVVFGVAMKTLSNYVNYMAKTPVDRQFSCQEWPAARS
jgi:AhpD family alkylhydroperoxidase